jgi:hypothetical protein
MPIEALSNAIDIIHIGNKNIIYTQNTVHTTHTSNNSHGHGHSQNLVLSQDALISLLNSGYHLFLMMVVSKVFL